MVKWFVYIVFVLVITPCTLSANSPNSRAGDAIALRNHDSFLLINLTLSVDTIKTNKSTTTKPDLKVKEVPKPKNQPKPEKIVVAKKDTIKRVRRPDGMQRPPEIPRRNDN